MANISELLINAVRKEQAKDADRLEPKGNVAGTEIQAFSVMDTKGYRRKRESLNHSLLD